ncbi:unnamed protein product [Camellia sinensis]
MRKISESRDDDNEEFSFFPPLPPVVPPAPPATDKGWKRINEQEDKAKQVSREGKILSSTPTETATETDWFGKKKTVKPSREGNADLLAFKKLTTHHDDDVISQSKPRVSCSSERPNQGLQYRASINQRNEYPMPNIVTVVDFLV